MSNVNPIAPSRAQIAVAESRDRQTPKAQTPFRDVLAGGVNVLVAGAQTTAALIGGPVLAAAVRQTLPTSVGGAPLAAGGAAAANDRNDMADMHAMQRESQAFNMQLLELQEEVQQENRRFTTLSNVLRAKHDTAKSAVGNIRS